MVWDKKSLLSKTFSTRKHLGLGPGKQEKFKNALHILAFYCKGICKRECGTVMGTAIYAVAVFMSAFVGASWDYRSWILLQEILGRTS